MGHHVGELQDARGGRVELHHPVHRPESAILPLGPADELLEGRMAVLLVDVDNDVDVADGAAPRPFWSANRRTPTLTVSTRARA